MKSDNLRHCFKFSLISLFQAFLSTLSNLDRENSTCHLFALGIPKLKNVSLKIPFELSQRFQLVHAHYNNTLAACWNQVI